MDFTSLYAASTDIGFMPLNMFLIFLIVAIVFALNAFQYTDDDNYTHIVTAFLSGIINIFLGFTLYLGIAPTDTTYYRSSIFGGLLVLFGIYMCIFSVAAIFENARKAAEENNL